MLPILVAIKALSGDLETHCLLLSGVVGNAWWGEVYRGAPAAARNYLDADRSRADDYYLAEGTGVARRFTAGPAGPVVDLAPLSGDGYEAWVAGLDPDTGQPRGRLRTHGRAVRFVEVSVNGPKSWSLAAELQPDIAAAYEAAQDRAAGQVIDWLAQHATTRVGPRSAQVAVPVDRLEAVTVRHYTSRAGDPHRHLHLQVNARVSAAGKRRGLDTVAVRDSIHAINGIGHAAVACDPEFRAALAGHGYTLNPDGEIEQLAQFVGPFSRRAEQIAANTDRYEAERRREHPNQVPRPGQWRAWDARAWADARPDKVVPELGAEVHGRWLSELAALGYRDRHRPAQLARPLPGQVEREAAVAEVLARLGAARSAWNTADARGDVEQCLVRQISGCGNDHLTRYAARPRGATRNRAWTGPDWRPSRDPNPMGRRCRRRPVRAPHRGLARQPRHDRHSTQTTRPAPPPPSRTRTTRSVTTISRRPATTPTTVAPRCGGISGERSCVAVICAFAARVAAGRSTGRSSSATPV
jgi:conjugative relaxase-like TrwC/TraI family protein